MIRVGIVGAAGYAGGELIRLLAGHEGCHITTLVSRTYAGKPVFHVYPGFYGYDLPHYSEMSVAELAYACDVVFVAAPSGAAWPWIRDLLDVNSNMKVIDIGSDLRLKDPMLYKKWYGYEHGAPELLSQAVYGLPELYADDISKAQLVANPGCYPTATILGLAPLLQNGLIHADSIIINALSGVSGAGRTPGPAYHFPECNENMRAYGLLSHRHIPEMEQELTLLAEVAGCGCAVKLSFTPHLVPLNRGILVTSYASLRSEHWAKSIRSDAYSDFGSHLDTEGLTELYRNFYEAKQFIRVLPPDRIPETKAVAGSNYCDIGVRADGRTGRVVVMSVIDNLVKGAAGQAVQNMNLMFGEPEDKGLCLAPVWP